MNAIFYNAVAGMASVIGLAAVALAAVALALLLSNRTDENLWTSFRSRRGLGLLSLLLAGCLLVMGGQLLLSRLLSDRAEVRTRIQLATLEPMEALAVQVYGPDLFRDLPDSCTLRLIGVTRGGQRLISELPGGRLSSPGSYGTQVPANNTGGVREYVIGWNSVIESATSEEGRAVASRIVHLNDWRLFDHLEVEIVSRIAESIPVPCLLRISPIQSKYIDLFKGRNSYCHNDKNHKINVYKYTDCARGTLADRLTGWRAEETYKNPQHGDFVLMGLLAVGSSLLVIGIEFLLPGGVTNRRAIAGFWSPWLLPLLAGGAIPWAILFAVLPPGKQDFPLNDDFAYAAGAFTFARGGGIHYVRWGAMPLLGQWLWSWPFVRFLGESHVALRFSTIILSLAGVAAFFDLLRQADLPPRRAAFIAACLAANPLFFLLSGTFMSDVPSLAFSLITLALYWRAMQSGRLDLVVAGAGVAVLGAITRQNTITAPIAAGLLLLRYPRLRARPLWLSAIATPILAAVITHVWYTGRPDSNPMAFKIPKMGDFIWLAFTTIPYMGLSATPLLLLETGAKSWKGFVAALVVLLAACAAFWFARRGLLFPFWGNTLTPFGPVPYAVGDLPLLMPKNVCRLLTLLGCVTGAALLSRLGNRLRMWTSSGPLPVYTALNLPLIYTAAFQYDRYLIVLIPGVLFLTSDPRADVRPRWKSGLAALVVFGLLATGLMHDWLAWNSARWDLGRRALERGIAVADIEGAYEWDLWNYGQWVGWDALNSLEMHTEKPVRGLKLQAITSWLPITARYALSLSMHKNTRVLEHIDYSLWMIPGRRRFYLVEELDPSRP